MSASWITETMHWSLFVGVLGAVVGCRDQSERWAAQRAALVAELRADGIGDERVLQAIAGVPRHEFVRPSESDRAYDNHALPIDAGQTISQPYVVAYMSEALGLHGDERVLEIGTGSGYQAAVLSRLAGQVYSVEIDAGLAEAAARRLQRLGFGNVHCRAGDGFFGWPEAAPFDAILITAATPRIPERLVQQLRQGGRMVLPLGDSQGQDVVVATRVGETVRTRVLLPVVFVPMTGAVRQGEAE